MAPANKKYKDHYDEEQKFTSDKNEEVIVAQVKDNNKARELQAPTSASLSKAALFLATFFVVITMIVRIYAKDD